MRQTPRHSTPVEGAARSALAVRGARSHGRSVGIFVDFDNLQRSLHVDPDREGEVADVAERLSSLAEEEGRVCLARAYGDWTVYPLAARDFRRRRIEPVLALSKESGESRTCMELALDAQATLFGGPDLDTYVLASGDTHLQPVLRRLRESGRRIVLASTREAAGREMVQGSDRVIWLEEVPDFPVGEEEAFEVEAYDWGPFVRLLHGLETNLEFVGLNYLIRRVLDRNNCGYSDLRRKQEVINAAQAMGLIEVYQVENKEEGGDPVSACQLVPDHPVVERHLGVDGETDAISEGQAT